MSDERKELIGQVIIGTVIFTVFWWFPLVNNWYLGAR